MRAQHIWSLSAQQCVTCIADGIMLAHVNATGALEQFRPVQQPVQGMLICRGQSLQRGTMSVVLLLLVPEIGPPTASPRCSIAAPEWGTLSAPPPLGCIHC